jgi:hypothetical protein
MISEFGTYNARIESDTTWEAEESVQEAGITRDPNEASVAEVTIGSLLFDSPTIYSSLPRRRFRVRSSTVI